LDSIESRFNLVYTGFCAKRQEVKPLKIAQLECQVLVVGGGGAGVMAAISAAREGARVTLLNQGPVARTGLTVMAGGGVMVVGGQKDPRDSIDLHFEDLVVRGHYLGDQNLIEVVTQEAPERCIELEKYGAKLIPVNFFRGETLSTTEAYGHSFPRGYFLHGSALMKVLRKELLRHPEITLLEDYFTYRLLTGDGRVGGALCLDMRKGEFVAIRSPAVILATGGAGELYALTSNWPQRISGNARGTGYALALQAGAKLVDMEMTQFYPATPVGPPAIWGIHSGVMEDIVPNAGAKVLNKNMEEFLEFPLVRDRTARSIYREIKEGRGTPAGGVYVDVTKSSIPEAGNIIKERVPAYKQYKSLGVDITQGPFEVAPSFHFQIGGVRINENAETSLSGLYAAGEVSGNTHGANRLAGSAVPELLAFGHRAGRNAARRAAKEKAAETDPRQIEEEMDKVQHWCQTKKAGVRTHELRDRLGSMMYSQVGVSRTAQGITQALEEIDRIRSVVPQIQVCDHPVFNLGLVDAKEIDLMIDAAKTIATSALIREESRGAHYREDFPSTDYQNWTKHIVLEKKGEQLQHTLEPVRITRIKPPETKQ
jgi:fumarate reductase (CoM/CoB) subunit A